MNKQQKIDVIYEKISDKTLSFGCIYLDRERRKCTYYPCTTIHKDTNDLWNFYWHYYEVEDWENIWYIKIIWHPVMIWDVLDFIEKLDQWLWEDHIKVWSSVRHKFDTKTKIIGDKRKHKRLPIDEQSEECIAFIYNLIQDDN